MRSALDSGQPDGESPNPCVWPEPEWAPARSDQERLLDFLDALSMAVYVREGHPLRLAMRSPNGVPWIGPEQYVFFARVDDADAFWTIHERMKRRYPPPARREGNSP